MSRTIRNVKHREKTFKLEDKHRSDLVGAVEFTYEQVKFLKKQSHKHNRRVGKRDATNGSYHAHEA